MKASRSSQPKSPGKVHSVRITLSSRDVKNLEKGEHDFLQNYWRSFSLLFFFFFQKVLSTFAVYELQQFVLIL